MSGLLQQILDNPARLAALRQLQLLDSPPEESFDRLTSLAATILKAPLSLVSLVESERQFFKSQVGLPEPLASHRETPISHSFCKHVVASGKPLIIDDSRLHSLVQENPAVNELNVVSYLGIPLKSPDGHQLGSFCVIDNEARVWTESDTEIMKSLAEFVMTEIKLRLEVMAKEDALRELQTQNQELDAFAHTVSHNLKNPISAILGWTSLSIKYSDRMSSFEQIDAIKKIGDISSKANDIINALLLLAGVNRSNLAEYSELNMFNIIDDALSRLEIDITDSGAILNIQDPKTFPSCVGNRQWIEEVWMNYISNAIKYGGEPPQIEIGAEQLNDKFVRYWIKDNGKGLIPTEQDRLFIPFNRLAETSNVEGHGLGLSIVERIVEKLGGEVGVTSVVGEGSTFSFTLPIV